MSIKKPSKEEEKWIKKQEIDRKVLLDNIKLKQEHWMKCPNCGHDLKKVPYPKADFLKIKSCDYCGAICLDEGDLDIIIQAEIRTFAQAAREFLYPPKKK